jgi:hypothetical protein
MEEKSAEYAKTESKLALLIVAIFVVWCPVYLVFVRPMLNEFVAGYVSSYPAMLHLIPILGPVVLLAWLMGRKLPPKTA